jgi:hypothetical protein
MSKIPGKCAVLQMVLSSTTYTTVDNGIEIVPFSGSNQAINTTILTSTAQRKEGAAIPDYGDMTWTGFHDITSTTHVALAAAFSNASSTNQFRINFADTDTSMATFVGTVTGYAPTGVVQDQMVQTQWTIAIDGAVAWTT